MFLRFYNNESIYKGYLDFYCNTMKANLFKSLFGSKGNIYTRVKKFGYAHRFRRCGQVLFQKINQT